MRILNTVEMREFDCSHDVVPLDEVASVRRETKDSVEADETGFMTAAFAPSREAWRRAVPASMAVEKRDANVESALARSREKRVEGRVGAPTLPDPHARL